MRNKLKQAKKWMAGWTMTLLLAWCVLPAHAAGAYSFEPSGLDGAGFQNVAASKPGDANYVLSGSDVAGVQLSTDGGATWTLHNEGIESIPHLKVAAIAFQNASTVFIAVGNGTTGAIYKSVNGGAWSAFTSTLAFSGGNNSASVLPKPHPRSTGNLLAFDSTGTYLYAGTFDQGVYRCALSTGACTNIGMSGLYIRSLVIDPLDDTLLYASAYNNADPTKTGVFKGTGVNAGSGEHFSRLTSPSTANDAYYVEELKFIGDNMMVAVGKDKNGNGVVYKVQNQAATWTAQKTQAGSNYISVDGYWNSAASKFVVVVGAADHAYNNESVLYSTDSGATWNTVTPHFGTGDRVGGGTWWLPGNDTTAMINGPTYVGASIRVTNTADKTFYMAGRSGMWKSTDQGANWYPAVRNMNVTFNRGILVDEEGADTYIDIVDTDWQFLYSGNAMTDVAANDSGMASGASGMAVAVNSAASPHITYVGVGNRNNNTNGAIYSSTSPRTGTWSDEGLGSAPGYNHERVLGLAAKQIASTPVLLAAVEGKGIYRKSGSTWSLVNTAVLGSPSTKTAPMVWDQSRTVAYLYDRDTGIYRSNDDGVTWSLVYAAPAAKVNGSETGYLALDQTNDRLYFSNHNGLYYQSGASASAFSSPTLVSSNKIGPIAYKNNRLYAAGLATNTAPLPTADIYTYAFSGALTSIGDDFYKNNGGFPLGIDVDSSGNIYVAMNGLGVLVGKP